jgi:hypothetical protein
MQNWEFSHKVLVINLEPIAFFNYPFGYVGFIRHRMGFLFRLS